ncbi:MAG: prolyl oligopeptidase family serine peptidase [Fuerstiella sp.]|nr:prolyl oligopeptidase family serine peptidase [Fuerstiella sp.]MCP4857480.1 prolyl oligopeptidase family serine peptidase [Fuerstiella sp.]
MFRYSTVGLLLTFSSLSAADWSLEDNPELAKYFETQVAKIETQDSLFQHQSLAEWQAAKPKLREQLFDMLGLHPLPARTPLQPQQTGIVEEEEFRVEKLHFQSMPGLYVTANLYLPKEIDKPLPTVLYVCGHARVKENDISFGNKTGYQHHGAWFARNGYACLTIDTLQLGEIEGMHHGTYKYDRWWWNARGYTPAGVEAWNCIRALDYLETRPEIDADRIGVTGRSGGGAYSWWIAAIDERIKCAIPVAGIATLRNHVVDGCVEGHCDCMYMLNSHRWDYATVAALVAPRPLLISNSDKDRIFPLDGVVEIHRQVRHIYELYQQPLQLGLQITEGPHKDTQELRVHAFRWLNRWLQDDDSLIEKTATKYFDPAQLRVFADLPPDERNTTIDDDFVPIAKPFAGQTDAILRDQGAWFSDTVHTLRQRCFAGWPSEAPAAQSETPRVERLERSSGSPDFVVYRLHFDSEQHVPVSVDLVLRAGDADDDAELGSRVSELKSINLFVTDSQLWSEYASTVLGVAPAGDSPIGGSDGGEPSGFLKEQLEFVRTGGAALAVFAPRGTGLHSWNGDGKKQTQIRRRFQMIGTTADAMRVWDVRRAVQVLRQQVREGVQLHLVGRGKSAWLAAVAVVFESDVDSVSLISLPESRNERPVFLNADRNFSPSELLTLALYRTNVLASGAAAGVSEPVARLAQDARWQGGTFQRVGSAVRTNNR